MTEATAILTRVSAVRELSADKAARKLPVRLRGVVTYYNPTLADFFLQDDSGGIYIDQLKTPVNLRPGMTVEVSGTTLEGSYSPMVEPSAVTILGTDVLPKPRVPDWEQMPARRRARAEASSRRCWRTCARSWRPTSWRPPSRRGAG